MLLLLVQYKVRDQGSSFYSKPLVLIRVLPILDLFTDRLLSFLVDFTIVFCDNFNVIRVI